MYKFIFTLAIVALGVVGYFWYQNEYKNPTHKEFVTVTLQNDEVELEVLRTFVQKSLGLSFREELPLKTGLLFVFSETANPEIWMKDMNFAIDIIFVNKEGKVVKIFENATPESYFEKPPRLFGTLEASRYVIEVPSFTAHDAGLREGMVIEELVPFK
jgi:uncharacterized membrane protein (UPF0127 family)